MNKKENEIIAQKRKAQKEFIELKKMQSGEISIEKKPSIEETMPKTPKEKIKNFWFYHKTQSIIAILAAAVLIFAVSQCAARPYYDGKVVIYIRAFLSDIHLRGIKDYMTPYFEDINGDGEINIQFIDCSYTTEGTYDLDYVKSQSTKLQALISSEPAAQLFITDNITTNELDTMFSSAEHFFVETVILPQQIYSPTNELGLTLPDGLTLGKRIVDGTMIQNKKDITKHTEQASSVFEKIKN